MEVIKPYIISVTATAVICGSLLTLIGNKGISATIVRLITGILMTCTILSPLLEIKLENLEYITSEIMDEAHAAISSGKKMATAELHQHIKTNLQAYILDKASALQVDMGVDIQLNEDSNSVDCITISGNISPYAKKELINYIEDNLGVSREVLVWQN